MRVVYIGHSCFFVELEKHVMLFDYFKGKLPEFPRDKKSLVFVSHAHYDHYQETIFEWGKKNPDVSYVISSDVRGLSSGNARTIVEPGMTIMKEDVQIKTLKSTDEGVAFIAEAEGKRIYHAGDLNWWHWEDEDDETWNIPMAKAYCSEIDKIEGMNIDVGFVPVDTRQEKNYLLGLDYYMKKTNTTHAFPMHMWDDSICPILKADLDKRDYAERVIILSKPLSEAIV